MVSSVGAQIGQTYGPYADEDGEASDGLPPLSLHNGWASLLAIVDKKIREYETTKAVDSAHFGIKFSIVANDVLQCSQICPRAIFKHLQFLIQPVPHSEVCVSKPRGSQPLTDLSLASAHPPAQTRAMAPRYSESA